MYIFLVSTVILFELINPVICLSRCKCTNYSLELVVQHEECRCCMEFERCRERMAEVEKDDECVTSHPTFESVCLNRWVLATAAIGLKTKQKKGSTTLLAEGNTTEDK